MGYTFHDKLHLTADVTVHALILFIFLSVFFIFYVSQMTTTEMNKQLSNLIDDNLTNGLNKINETNKTGNNNVASVLGALPLSTMKSNYNKESLLQTTNNNWLKRDLLICNIAFFSIVVGAMILITKICSLDLDTTAVLKINAYIFVCIGIVEYVFFTKVGLNYIPAPPSLMITSIINDIKQYFSTN